jgi:nicotinamidase/pyrazinamidase
MHPTHHVSFASRHKLNPFSVLFINGKKQELWPEHCIVGTHGSEIHKLLEIQGD